MSGPLLEQLDAGSRCDYRDAYFGYDRLKNHSSVPFDSEIVFDQIRGGSAHLADQEAPLQTVFHFDKLEDHYACDREILRFLPPHRAAAKGVGGKQVGGSSALLKLA